LIVNAKPLVFRAEHKVFVVRISVGLESRFLVWVGGRFELLFVGGARTDVI
jgi:hypothetical protein